ncbi:MAG: hypothetical protein IJ459_02820 [Clostridia bacterium]|nr:hypothetical protein [Clostridia bacterium]
MKQEIKNNPYANVNPGPIKAPNSPKSGPKSTVIKSSSDLRSKAGK